MVTESTPKFLLYVFDSLRADHLGCYGYEDHTTPSLDGLADDGVRFDGAFSQGIWTFPSAASLFTGLYPETHGSHQFDEPIAATLPHLADGLGETDIVTACFSTTLGLSPERGFARGFDEFHHLGRDGDALRPDVTERLNEALVPWLEQHADEPFFVVVWAMGTHHPFLTPSTVEDPSRSITSDPSKEGSAGWLMRQPTEAVGRVNELYDTAVSHADAAFGEVLDLLRRRGIYNETTVLATADHGELFDEHARLEHAHPIIRRLLTSLLPPDRRRRHALVEPPAWLGHQAVFPYEELIHVPLILKPGDRDVETDATDELVELVDVYSTVREALDVDGDPRVQGRSLYDTLRGSASREYVYSSSQVHNGNLVFRSIRSETEKLCTQSVVSVRRDSDSWSRSLKLLAAYAMDRKELLLTDLDDEERPLDDPIRRQELHGELSEHLDRCERWRADFETGTERVHVDESTKEHLADLGYT